MSNISQEHDAVCKEALDFYNFYQSEGLVDKYKQKIETNTKNNLQNSWHDDKFLNCIENMILNRKAFSLMRFGDGEGNCLFYYTYKNKYPELARWCMRQISQIMFGNRNFDDIFFDKISRYVYEAAVAGDILGIPDRHQTETTINSLKNPNDTDIRGMCGAAAVWAAMDANNIITDRTYITDWFCHTPLLKGSNKWLDVAVENNYKISAISCYENLLDVIQRKKGATKGELFVIPPQASNINGTPDAEHFPGIFDIICEEINKNDLSGHLFIVAAGILGKFYCKKITQAGGIAIDAGSIVDAWMGLSVRPHQDADFIKQWSMI